jgi:hypothetical protein
MLGAAIASRTNCLEFEFANRDMALALFAATQSFSAIG